MVIYMYGYIYNQMFKHCSCEVSFAFCWYALWNKLYKNTCYSFPKKPHSEVEGGVSYICSTTDLENFKNKLANKILNNVVV